MMWRYILFGVCVLLSATLRVLSGALLSACFCLRDCDCMFLSCELLSDFFCLACFCLRESHDVSACRFAKNWAEWRRQSWWSLGQMACRHDAIKCTTCSNPGCLAWISKHTHAHASDDITLGRQAPAQTFVSCPAGEWKQLPSNLSRFANKLVNISVRECIAMGVLIITTETPAIRRSASSIFYYISRLVSVPLTYSSHLRAPVQNERL